MMADTTGRSNAALQDDRAGQEHLHPALVDYLIALEALVHGFSTVRWNRALTARDAWIAACPAQADLVLDEDGTGR